MARASGGTELPNEEDLDNEGPEQWPRTGPKHGLPWRSPKSLTTWSTTGLRMAMLQQASPCCYFTSTEPIHKRSFAIRVCQVKMLGDTSLGDWAEKTIYTAVAQLSSFCLSPIRCASRSFLRSNSGERGGGLEEAAPTALAVSLQSKSLCGTPALPHRDDKSEEDGGPEGGLPPSWTRPVGKRKGGPSYSSSEKDVETRHSAASRKYCSQACLLGLKKGGDLDDGCPNVLSHHIASGDGLRHPVAADQFTRLVSEQLRENPYKDCYALDGRGKKGAIGVLFELELTPYGYTFVGTGTLANGPKRLQHEWRVYTRLDTLQGCVVPVHLGLVHLDKGYVLPAERGRFT
ncbi:hypothetical protein BKA67DRAFT_537126 [Truncatella angustata]|uniref:Uncharacterized protein n=1 Tax=Truncatella angustata TaxID=152316 RepID=A0A9P8UK39_9PEZI|nr:uncharacterized protein BKA67DRAFT_537126 [Truncatella angustata]KAH6653450.1 hypothetical protein BKA67DRAFT_537126 [Truncatella angustata]